MNHHRELLGYCVDILDSYAESFLSPEDHLNEYLGSKVNSTNMIEELCSIGKSVNCPYTCMPLTHGLHLSELGDWIKGYHFCSSPLNAKITSAVQGVTDTIKMQ